jgi:hypothetical protein
VHTIILNQHQACDIRNLEVVRVNEDDVRSSAVTSWECLEVHGRLFAAITLPQADTTVKRTCLPCPIIRATLVRLCRSSCPIW